MVSEILSFRARERYGGREVMHAFVSASAALPGIGYSMEIFFHVGKIKFDSSKRIRIYR